MPTARKLPTIPKNLGTKAAAILKGNPAPAKVDLVETDRRLDECAITDVLKKRPDITADILCARALLLRYGPMNKPDPRREGERLNIRTALTRMLAEGEIQAKIVRRGDVEVALYSNTDYGNA